MKKCQIIFLLIFMFILCFITNSNSVKADSVSDADGDVSYLMNKYYYGKEYKKDTEIFLDMEKVEEELSSYFHAKVSDLIKTTYYKEDELWLSTDDGYSGYGTTYVGDVVHLTQFKVSLDFVKGKESKTGILGGMEGYYLTLHDFVEGSHLSSHVDHKLELSTGWSYQDGYYITDNSDILDGFRLFTAPLWIGKTKENANYLTYTYATICEENDQLVMKLWLSSLDEGKLQETETLVVNGETHHLFSKAVVSNENAKDYKLDIEGITFEDKTVKFDGNGHSLEINGDLPEGVFVEYSEINIVNAGIHTVIATFVDTTGKYNVPEPMTATLTINYSDNDSDIAVPTTELPFKYTKNGAYVTITSYTGKDADVVVPELIQEGNVYYIVNAIGNNSFYGNTSLVSVQLPESLTSIGEKAFQNCNKLKTVNIPSGVTTIQSFTFANCYALKNVTLPTTLTTIGTRTFYNCYNLTSLEIPNSVTSISTEVLYGCSALEKLTVPFIGSSIDDSTNTQLKYLFGVSDAIYVPTSLKEVEITVQTAINSRTFVNCSSLTTIVLPENTISIGSYAFANCTALVGFEIPNSVTSIGEYAFSGCKSLTNVTLPQGVSIIEKYVFNSCTSLTNIELSESLTSISSYAFNNCTSLTNIELPESLTNISNSAFYNCSSLIDVVIPDNVTSIGASAFSGCSSLESVTLPFLGDKLYSPTEMKFSYAFSTPASLKEVIVTKATVIGDNAFDGCNYIEKIVLPNSVTSIGKKVFYDCASLKEVVLSTNISTIPEYTFYGCSSLANFEIPTNIITIERNAFYNCTAITNIVVPNSVTSIGQYAFYGTSLESITLPFIGDKATGGSNLFLGYIFGSSRYSYNSSGVPTSLKEVILTGTTIPSNAFYGCASLTNIVFPYATSIGNAAFAGCTSLVNITIPETVTSIGTSAFSNCTNLTSINLPEGITVLSSSMFNNCISLTSIEIPNTVTTIDSMAFSDCTGLTNVEFPESVRTIQKSAFTGCISLTEIYVPSTVTSIGLGAFKNCTSLESITVPFIGEKADSTTYAYFGYIFGSSSSSNNASNVPTSLKEVVVNGGATVGNNAFYGCEHLTSISISSSVTSIGNYSFYNCSSLTSFNMPASLNSIGDSAFENTGLVNVIIPESVTKIGSGAFKNCNSLESITLPFVGMSPYASYNTHLGYIFGFGTGNSASSYIPESLTTVILTTATKLADQAFYNCASLTNIVIPESVTSIGNYAFYNCQNLSHLDLPQNLTSIGNYMFYNCISLRNLVIPSNVTSIGEYAFAGCTFSTIKLPNSLQSIGNYAFDSCLPLNKLSLPESLTTIGTYVFNNCTSLTEIYIPKNVTSIGLAPFYGCTSLESIVVDENNARYTSGDNWNAIIVNNSILAGCKNTIIPEYITAISSNAFAGTSVTHIELPSSVKYIHTNAFMDCASLVSIKIPTSVIQIGNYAFANCESLFIAEYAGTEAKWQSVIVGNENDILLDKIRFHVHGSVEAVITEPTCTIQGYTTHTCSCGEVYVADYVDALGHDVVVDEAILPTCTATGLTTGNHCARCEITLVGQTTIPALGHDVVVDEEVTPDCENTGLTEGSHCGRCNVILTSQEVVPALGHTEVIDKAVSADCENNGLTEGSHCSTCNKVLVEQNEIPANGHSYGEVIYTWDLDKLTVTASCVCTIDTSHKLEETVQVYYDDEPATCKTAGRRRYYSNSFSKFENTFKIEELPALGHQYKNEVCTRCGDEEFKEKVNGVVYTLDTNKTYYTATGLDKAYWNNLGITSIDLVLEEYIDDIPVTHVGYDAFYSRQLNSIVISDTVEYIDAYAFGETKATSITLGKNVKTINSNAFSGYVSSRNVYYNGSIEEWCQITYGDGQSTLMTDNSSFYLKDSTGTYVKQTTIVIPGTVEKIGYKQFLNFDNITFIIENGVTTIGNNAFGYCGFSYSNPLSIPSSVTTIENDAFYQSNIYKVCYEGSAEDWMNINFGNCKSNPVQYLSSFYVDNQTTTSYNGDLFVTDCGHIITKTTKEPTCSTSGSISRTCTCGYSQSTYLDKLPHNYNVEVIAPTCTSQGYTLNTCKDCSSTTKTNYVSSLGHSYGEVSYVWSADNQSLTATRVCLHNSTHTENEKVSVTSQMSVAPTCLTDGTGIYTSNTFKNTAFAVQQKEYVIPALGHNVVIDKEVAADCINSGLTEGSHCGRCDAILTSQKVVPALGHNEVIDEAIEPTCNTAGKTEGSHCDRCDEVIVAQNVISMLDHYRVYDEAVAPTCTTTGLTLGIHCDRCGLILNEQTIIPMIDHNFVDKQCTMCDSLLESVGLTFELLSDGTYAVTGMGECQDTRLVIPSIHNGQKVTKINRSAFSNNNVIVEVVIPNTITTIEDWAFDGCNNLKSLYIPCSVTTVGKTIVSNNYSKQTSILAEVETQPAGWNSSFDSYYYATTYWGCAEKFLISVNEYQYVVYNEIASLVDCTDTNSVEINVPSFIDVNGKEYAVKSIGKKAFYKCSEVVKINISEGVEAIGDYAFIRYQNQTVVLPGSVNYISSSAFSRYNSDVLDVYYTGTLENWFNIQFPEQNANPFYMNTSGKLYLLNELGDYEFLTDIVVPESITEIGANQFTDYSFITSVLLHDGVVSVGESAFVNNYDMLVIYIPKSVKTMGAHIFSNCNKLTIYCEASSKPSGWDTYWASNVTNIVWNAPYLYSDDFYFGVDNSTNTATILRSTSNDSSIAIPSAFSYNGKTFAVTAIGTYAFSNKNNLKNIVIPGNIITIGTYSFNNCTNLVEVIINNGVTTIETYAFKNCAELKRVLIAGSVNTVGEYAFSARNCTYYCEVTAIPSGWSSDWRNWYGSQVLGFSAAEKTYTFEVNGGLEIESITSIFPITLPTPINNGKYFLGWYDNPEFSGNAITGTYSSDTNQILYAKWGEKIDETSYDGSSFDKSIFKKNPSYYMAHIEDSGDKIYIRFVVAETKSYEIYSTSCDDAYAYLYDADRKYLDSGDDERSKYNFSITYTLEAGKVYYLVLSSYEDNDSYYVYFK